MTGNDREGFFERRANDLLARHRRATDKCKREEAAMLRAIVHNWIGVDEVVMVNPGGLARQILAALDALAILHANEAECLAFDEVLDRMSQRDAAEAAKTPGSIEAVLALGKRFAREWTDQEGCSGGLLDELRDAFVALERATGGVPSEEAT